MVWAPNYRSAMKMLAQNRADVFIGSEYSVLYTINKLQNDDANNFPRLARIIATDNAIDALSYSLLINKRSPYINLIQQFNATLDEMRDDGSYDRIIRQYFTKKLNAKKLPSFIALPTQ